MKDMQGVDGPAGIGVSETGGSHRDRNEKSDRFTIEGSECWNEIFNDVKPLKILGPGNKLKSVF